MTNLRNWLPKRVLRDSREHRHTTWLKSALSSTNPPHSFMVVPPNLDNNALTCMLDKNGSDKGSSTKANQRPYEWPPIHTMNSIPYISQPNV